MVTTKKSKTEVCNFKERGNRGKIIEYHQTETEINTRERKQWRHSYQKTTVKWLQDINNHPKWKWAELPQKRHRVVDCIKKQNPRTCCLWETHLSCKDKSRLKMKGCKMILQANGIQRKAGIAILTSDKVDFKIKKVTRDRGTFQWVIGRMHFITIHNDLFELPFPTMTQINTKTHHAMPIL